MDDENLSEIQWTEVYKKWRYLAEDICPDLLNSIEIELIKVDFEVENRIFCDFDWIEKKGYNRRIEYVKNNPVDYLVWNGSINKGSKHTVELLLHAKNDSELLAAIWISAFLKEIEKAYKYIWTGNAYKIASHIEQLAVSKVGQSFNLWHFAMTKLVPEIFSHTIC